MKLLVLMSLFVVNFAFASEQPGPDSVSEQCISTEQAQTILTEYLGQSPFDTIFEDFPFMDVIAFSRLHGMPKEQILKSIIGSMRYYIHEDHYRTKTVTSGYYEARLRNGQYVPRELVWGWYKISCQGQVEKVVGDWEQW